MGTALSELACNGIDHSLPLRTGPEATSDQISLLTYRVLCHHPLSHSNLLNQLPFWSFANCCCQKSQGTKGSQFFRLQVPGQLFLPRPTVFEPIDQFQESLK